MNMITHAVMFLTGAKVVEKCEVEKVLTDGRKVTGVETSKGRIDCKYFVNAAGMVSLTCTTRV